MYRTYIPERYLESFASLVGTRPMSYSIDRTSPVDGNAVLIEGHGIIETKWQNPRTIVLTYDVPEGGVARIDQIYSPLWRTSTPRGASPANSSQGVMNIQLTAGRHELALEFQGGWPEFYGKIITLLSITFVLTVIACDIRMTVLKVNFGAYELRENNKKCPNDVQL